MWNHRLAEVDACGRPYLPSWSRGSVSSSLLGRRCARARRKRDTCVSSFSQRTEKYTEMHGDARHSHSVLTLRSDAPRPPPVLSRVRENPAERQRDAESGVDAASRGESVPREGP